MANNDVGDRYKLVTSSTNMSYGQASPMLWRILYVLNIIMADKKLELKVPDLSIVYTLTTFGSGFYILKVKDKNKRLIGEVTQNDDHWKNRFFFVKRESLPVGSYLPSSWVAGGKIIRYL